MGGRQGKTVSIERGKRGNRIKGKEERSGGSERDMDRKYKEKGGR